MPVVDMPLDKLYEYKGMSPCPSDIDEYWDDALAEMNAICDEPEFTPVDIGSTSADFYDLYFTGTKGAKIHAKFGKPKNINGKVPAVLLFHGLSGSSDAWNALLNYISQGYVVAFLDTRGQGGLSQDIGGLTGTTFDQPFIRGIDGDKHDLLLRDCFLDTAQLAKIVMGLEYVDENRVAAHGGSQGGGLSLACASLVPNLKLCAPVYPYLSDYKRVWDMDLDTGAYSGLRYYFKHFDPTHAREDEIFERLGYVDIQNMAHRINAEVLMATGLLDTTCPPSTQFAAYNKITSKKQVVIYPDYGHEHLKGHGDIVFKFFSKL